MPSEESMPPTAKPDVRLTYEDLCLLPDDGKRHEIIDGVHYVTPSPVTRHQRIILRLSFALEEYFRRDEDGGEVFVAPLDILFTDYDVVEPDLFVVTGNQQGIITERNIQGAPALVVEVLSPGTRKRDEQIKRRLYEREGVREYWIADPELDLIRVFRRSEDGRLPRVVELTAEDGDTLTTPLLPGFDLSLDRLFAR